MNVHNVKKICAEEVEYDGLFNRNLVYHIYDEEMNDYTYFIKMPYNKRISISNNIKNILAESNPALVQFDNKEYGYVKDNNPLFARYDFATDFDRNGYAICSKDGMVNIINRDLEFLDTTGHMVSEEVSNFKGFKSVEKLASGYELIKADGTQMIYAIHQGEIDIFVRYLSNENNVVSVKTKRLILN